MIEKHYRELNVLIKTQVNCITINGGMTTSLVQGSARLTTDYEVAGSIPGTSTNFKCGLGMKREDNWVAT